MLNYVSLQTTKKKKKLLKRKVFHGSSLSVQPRELYHLQNIHVNQAALFLQHLDFDPDNTFIRSNPALWGREKIKIGQENVAARKQGCFINARTRAEDTKECLKGSAAAKQNNISIKRKMKIPIGWNGLGLEKATHS